MLLISIPTALSEIDLQSDSEDSQEQFQSGITIDMKNLGFYSERSEDSLIPFNTYDPGNTGVGSGESEQTEPTKEPEETPQDLETRQKFESLSLVDILSIKPEKIQNLKWRDLSNDILKGRLQERSELEELAMIGGEENLNKLIEASRSENQWIASLATEFLNDGTYTKRLGIENLDQKPLSEILGKGYTAKQLTDIYKYHILQIQNNNRQATQEQLIALLDEIAQRPFAYDYLDFMAHFDYDEKDYMIQLLKKLEGIATESAAFVNSQNIQPFLEKMFSTKESEKTKTTYEEVVSTIEIINTACSPSNIYVERQRISICKDAKTVQKLECDIDQEKCDQIYSQLSDATSECNREKGQCKIDCSGARDECLKCINTVGYSCTDKCFTEQWDVCDPGCNKQEENCDVSMNSIRQELSDCRNNYMWQPSKDNKGNLITEVCNPGIKCKKINEEEAGCLDVEQSNDDNTGQN